MRFYASAVTDPGAVKTVNQDCVYITQLKGPIGPVVFAVVCDGMGGLSHGEIASRSVNLAFADWTERELPALVKQDINDWTIREHWTRLIAAQNTKIFSIGRRDGFTTGTTVTALLLTEKRYFLLNVGDSRAYEIGDTVRQLTQDHTIIANEVRLGNLTPAQAEEAPMKNVLTRCVGATENAYPDLFFGTPNKNTVYMLCSDGFRHHVSDQEFREYLLLQNKPEPEWMKAQAEALIALNKRRGEVDNISVAMIYAI